MSRIARAHVYIAGQIGGLLLIVLLLLLIGLLVSEMRSDYGVWRLKSEADAGLLSAENRLIQSRLQIDSLSRELGDLKNRAYPDLQTLRLLAGDHRIRLRKTERITSGDNAAQEQQRYSVTLEGSITGLVTLLKTLEDDYILRADQIIMGPADEEGSTAAMYVILAVRPS